MQPTLERRLTLPLLVLYGVGTTVGAGIYALVGEIAGRAGMLAPLSFVAASVLAGFSAGSFAELSSRFPRSAGEAVYVREGLGLEWLGTAVGLLVVTAGTVSAATMCVGFVGYSSALLAVPPALAVLFFALLLFAVAAWGIGESVTAAGVITLIEVGGLCLVVWAARASFAELPARAGELVVPGGPEAWLGVATGALLAFYAFLGFEDLVNVAEEVIDAPRNVPRAIFLTLLVTTIVYVVVATTAVLAVAPADLAGSSAPLTLVYHRASGQAAGFMGTIAVVALLNGALIQVIMASRILYGLASQGALPAVLGRIHPRSHTPVIATASVVVALAALALWLPIGQLAELTSLVTLSVFSLVNLSLVRIKRREARPAGTVTVPAWMPLVGFTVSVAFLMFAAVKVLGG